MATINGKTISLMPTAGMREEAKRYQAWKAEGRDGGTAVAARRARQLLSGNELAPSVVLLMSAWFARHEVDKQGEGFSPGSAAYPSPGRVAWAAWGGDAGKTWSDRRAKQIKDAQDRTARLPSSEQDNVELKAAANELRTGDYVAWQSSGGTARGRIEHIMREGVLGVPDSTFSIEASAEDPAALIRIYSKQGDGWVETETLVGHKFSTLRKIEALSEPSSKFMDNTSEQSVVTETRELSADMQAPQVALYEALEEIVDELGEFDQGSGAHGAHYMANNPFASEGMQCSNCAFYAGPRACEVVGGDIDPAGICKFWIIPERLLSGEAMPQSNADRSAAGLREVAAVVEEQRPYPNEHAARLLDPAQFERFRRKNNELGQGIAAIYGISGNDPVKLQALRFDASKFTATEAKKWLSDHDYKPLVFEAATGKSRGLDLKSINNEVLRREAAQGLRIEEREANGLTFSFSSEAPVERWWGREVLMHDEGAMDLGRMNDGGPWLWNHNRDVVLGVAEKAWLGSDRRLYVKTKWSPNTEEKGTEEYKRRKDIEAGIVRNVSFAYEINDVREASNGDMQVVGWNVLEVSSVSVPADQSVGLGRSHDTAYTTPAQLIEQETNQPQLTTLEAKQTAERGADTPLSPPSMEQAINVQEVQAAARQSERERVAAIRAMCDQHQVGVDLAERLINDDATLDQAREAVLSQIGMTRTEIQGRVHDDTSASLGLSDKETRQFSFVRAINYLSNPGDRAAREAAGFEIEVGAAAAKLYERSSNGIVVPNEVLRRDLVVGTSTAGGNLVNGDLLSGSFIDLLRNRMSLMQANITTLSGLQGNIAIPRQSSAATAYWLGEGGSPTESQQAIDQINMTPKTVGAYVDYSRRLLLQSSIDVESMIRGDLAKVIALELDRAAIYGTGSTNQPLGLTNTTGIGSQTITTYGTFAQYVEMETKVAVANADVASMYYIVNANARGALKTTERSASGTTASFVFTDSSINGYPAIVSNQLGTNDCLFGDFSQFVMGLWSGLDLTVDPYAGSTAGTVRVIALQDVDFAVKQPGAFVFGT